MKSESETKWISMMNEAQERNPNNNDLINEDSYEFEYDDSRDVDDVRCLD